LFCNVGLSSCVVLWFLLSFIALFTVYCLCLISMFAAWLILCRYCFIVFIVFILLFPVFNFHLK